MLFESGSNIEYINDGAFNNAKLRVIQFPKSLKEIGLGAFQGCASLEFIDFMVDGNLKIIQTKAFAECINLECLLILENIEEIHERAFKECIALEDIYFYKHSKSLHTIGKYVFEMCISLENIIMPNYIDHLSEGLFYNCDSLTNIYFVDNYITSIDNFTFYGCNSLKEFIIPSECLYIGDKVFAESSNIESIVLSP